MRQITLALLPLLNASALTPGDLMVVGYDSRTAPTDTISFVTWVELAAGESITIADADYDGDGDGSGQGSSGGDYSSVSTIEWTNTSGAALAPGTVIVISDTKSPSANIGSTSGSFGLDIRGEQFFLLQGSFTDGYLDGQLLFGVDYEGDPSWGESGESALPGALDVPNANLSFGDVSANEYQGQRSAMALSDYPAEIMATGNWAAPATSGQLSSTSFQTGGEPQPEPPDQLGAVSKGEFFYPERLNGDLPIIDESWMRAQGATSSESNNINGPSCIRIPDWIPAEERADPSAIYYLYFGHHAGDFIRMAWASSIEGPWTGYRMDSSLPLADRGVLSLGSDDKILPGNDIDINGHIASPQVFVDDANRQFVMYYHGPADHDGSDKGQSTIVASSADGLNFNLPSEGGQTGHGTRPVILGESYFRVFQQNGDFYAFSNTGDIWKAPDSDKPFNPPAGYDYSKDYWKRGPNPFVDEARARGWPDIRPRHFAVLNRDDILYAFLTYKEDRPERISAATFDFDALPDDYNSWKPTFPEQELLRAESDWEGAQFPPEASEPGAESGGVNQLRDPGILEDSDGRVYLFYCGQGEDAMGLARLLSAPGISGEAELVLGEDRTFTIGTEVDVTPAIRRISHSTPVDLDFDAESGSLPFLYSGNGGYPVVQTQTVGSGTRAFQLAHFRQNDQEILTFPNRYYARPGASLHFSSRLASATEGQFGAVQVSFDDTLWQTVWINIGGSPEGSFRTVSLNMDGLVGREFSLRFLYEHDELRDSSYISGAGPAQGWFLDDISSRGLESIEVLSEEAFTESSFTLESIRPLLAPFLADGSGSEDRFLLSSDGLFTGAATGYGKPFVIRVQTSYESFLADNFTDAERDDPAISDESADPDQDGSENLLEHVFATDPRRQNGSVVRITAAAGGGPIEPLIRFPWDPVANYSYHLQMSRDLLSFEDIPFSETITPDGSLIQVELKPDPSEVDLDGPAFFRIRVEAD